MCTETLNKLCNIFFDAQGDRGFDGIIGPKGAQGEKGERVSTPAI